MQMREIMNLVGDAERQTELDRAARAEQTKALRREAAKLYRAFEKSQSAEDRHAWMIAQRAYAASVPPKSRPASKAGMRQKAERLARYR